MSIEALARARSMLGVPFRLHGRRREGMDCIGLAAFAWNVDAPTGYPLRCGSRALIDRGLAERGFVPASPAPGRILLIVPGPGQLHLAIAGEDGAMIHADAVARRVVERPAPLPWPVLAAWTREEGAWRR